MSTLETQKKMKINAINENTVGLLSIGFSFGDIVFPTTDEDQRNYLGLNMAALNQLVTGVEMLDFVSELRLKAKGYNEEGEVAYHLFVDCPDIISFFMAGMGFVSAVLAGGWALKDAVEAANSLEALALVVDNR